MSYHVCNDCGYVLEDFCYEVDGKMICDDCFDDAFLVTIDEDVVCGNCGKIIDDEDCVHLIDGEYHCRQCIEDYFRITTPD